MINILRLLTLHFPLSIDKKIKILLEEDLSLKPEDLAIYIYWTQQKIVADFGEEGNRELLLALSYIQRIYTQIEIYYSATIGQNLKIIHGAGTVIGARVVIGDDVTIYQNVTIGDRGDGDNGRPAIEDNVKIFAGAKVLGDITVGENSVIGANTVLLTSCDKNSLMVGIPAIDKSKRDGRDV